MPVPPEAKRLQIVKKDQKKSNYQLGDLFGVSPETVRKMVNGTLDLNFRVIYGVCFILGYSPNWLLLGVGDKKQKGEEAKLITDLQAIRVELEISTKLNLRLQARMSGYEKEVDELKKEVALLKAQLKK